MSIEKTDPASSQRRGGIARSEGLSPARRSEIASRAAQARWHRGSSFVSETELEDFQMNTDTVDAAEILVTELNEQVVMLSRSGARALENGHIIQAKSIINAIESTQAFLDRAEQLKIDITVFYNRLIPGSDTVGGPNEKGQVQSDQPARRQDRTDRALLNAQRDRVLRQMETKYSVRLNRRSSATYKSDNNEIGVVCTVSKWYPDGDGYWYAYHSNQDQFLGSVKRGYFVLGMMDNDSAIVLPLQVIRENLAKLSATSIPGGKTYWHINVDRSGNGTLSLHRAKGEPPLRLDGYIMRIAPE
jgi:hypothetical protein